MDKWLEGFHAWQDGQTSTADYYEQEAAAAQARIQQAQEAGFVGCELMRLEVYRRATAAGFYNERSA